jgi:hypothetical protein
MMNIYPLLARELESATSRDRTTSSSTFHEIVLILSALVRLRRDLLLSTLPHLCNILRRLIFCLRSARPNLGPKQLQIVADTLPSWIDPSKPLGPEEGKALARLLSALTTKSVARVHSERTEPQKAESLARSLSKHAAYVLQAYVEAVNDPLCVISSSVRRELQPGLFALCEMLNEHARNNLMVSALDAAGKTTLKSLWYEYEKQRYVGKG